MIDDRLPGWPPPILKGRLLNTGSGLPQRPQRCKFFADGQITELSRGLDGEVPKLQNGTLIL